MVPRSLSLARAATSVRRHVSPCSVAQAASSRSLRCPLAATNDLDLLFVSLACPRQARSSSSVFFLASSLCCSCTVECMRCRDETPHLDQRPALRPSGRAAHEDEQRPKDTMPAVRWRRILFFSLLLIYTSSAYSSACSVSRSSELQQR